MFPPSFHYEAGKGRELELEQRIEKNQLMAEAGARRETGPTLVNRARQTLESLTAKACNFVAQGPMRRLLNELF